LTLEWYIETFKEQGVTMWTGFLWFQMENTVLNLCIS